MHLTSINLYVLKQVRVGRRRYEVEDCKITCPLACYRALNALLHIRSEPVEKFGVIALNAKTKILGLHIIAVGTLDTVYVEPREVFKAAMMNNAHSIIAFHNHPSGDPMPSKDDLMLTHRLQCVGDIMGITLLDHVITGKRGYVSLNKMGKL
jgi:DNA repair protein RadC